MKRDRIRPRIISLIGMPASGKSKIGAQLAKLLGWKFVDTDELIKRKFGRKTLKEVLCILTPTEFAKIEEAMIILAVMTATEPTIIATGGSAVYYRSAMQCLERETLVIHLWAQRDVIKRRIGPTGPDSPRGIVLKRGQTIDDLFAIRIPRYRKSADWTVYTSNGRAKTAKRIVKRLRTAEFV